MEICRSKGRVGLFPLPGSHRLISKWLRLSGPALILVVRLVAFGKRRFQAIHLPLLGTMLDTTLFKGILRVYEILFKSLYRTGPMQKWDNLVSMFASAMKTCNGLLEVRKETLVIVGHSGTSRILPH